MFRSTVMALAFAACSPLPVSVTDGGGGTGVDASEPDAGASLDSGTPDSGTMDSGIPDSGTPDSGAPRLGAYGSRTLQVAAQTYWTNTQLYVEPGTSFTVVPTTGQWAMGVGYPLHGAEGFTSQTVGGCRFGSLVAAIGFAWPDSWVCVGDGGTFVADAGGLLYLGPADGKMEDNSGVLSVVLSSSGARSVVVDAGEAAAFDFSTVDAGLVELQSQHVIVVVPTALASAESGSAALALGAFDSWYRHHSDLAGSTPYGGQRIRYSPESSIASVGAWMLSGNPIRFDPRALAGAAGGEHLLRSHLPTHSVWGFVHEMGHDFTFINGGRYLIRSGPTEAWANIFTLHALEKTGHPEAMRSVCSGVPAYLASGTYATFTQDPWLPLCMLLELKDRYGWTFYSSFFRYYNALNLSTVPPTSATDGARWMWLRDVFSMIAQEDTTPTFTKYKVPLTP